MSVSRAKLGYISLISHCTCRYTAPPLADVGQRRHFGRSRICGASPAPLRSIIDLFVGAPPKQESGHPQLPSPTDEDKQTAKATNASTRPRASSQGPYSSGRSGIFGNLLKKPRIARGDSGEADLLRAKNDEMSKALERMLRGGGRGTLATGNTGMDVRCTTLDQRGTVTTTARQFSKLELCSRYGIQPRDLRKLDSAVATILPTILVRRNCIILTMLHLRVVITGREVTLFDSVLSSGSGLQGAFIWHLEHALKSTGKVAHGLSYEHRAIESCLISVVTALEMELVNIRGLVLDLLQELEDHIERDKLRLLLQYSRKLSVFQKRATLVQECLEEVLENDDDLAAMYLTAKLENRPRSADDHEEVELLLESFSKQCEEIVSEVETLAANVKSTEDIIELILDSNRNSLLGLDLRVSIATLGLTSGALVAGLFGMLATSLESHPFAFPLVTVAAFALSGAVTLFGLRRLRQMRRIGLGWRGGELSRFDGVDKWTSGRRRLRSSRRSG